MECIIIILGIVALVLGLHYLGRKKAEKLFAKDKYVQAKCHHVYAEEALQNIKALSTLDELFNFHKSLTNYFDLNSNTTLGPCPYGIFRTKNIADMKKSEVYLGNIYGYWTKTLDYWESCTYMHTETESVAQLMTDQYRAVLISGLKSIRNTSIREINELNRKYKFE